MVCFFKYQGTGNDFVVLDNRNGGFDWLGEKEIALLCDRKFGVGADGLMTLSQKEGFDFEMRYFNANGKEGSMCGNGGRCIVAFAKHLGVITNQTHFLAVDGPHEASIDDNDLVSIKMIDVHDVKTISESDYELDTGSPHYVRFVDDLGKMDIEKEGKAIRYNEVYHEKGINVNFASTRGNQPILATYERGVEAETLSCGTGTVATAICLGLREGISHGKHDFKLKVKGGELGVAYHFGPKGFSDITLTGPAVMTFRGEFLLF